MALLATLLTNNFDDIISNLDEGIKSDIVNNKVKNRAKSYLSFEDGSPYEFGVGLKIESINKKQANNNSRILINIRNGIAHSNFEYENGMVYINNQDFKACMTLEWIEMMVLGLFSNRNQTNKRGSSDLFILDTFNGKVTDNESFNVLVDNLDECEITLTSDGELSLESVISGFKANFNDSFDTSKYLNIYMFVNHLNASGNGFFKITNKPLKDDFVKLLEPYGYYFFNTASKKSQKQIISNLNAITNSEEKRNTLAYKNILEILYSISESTIDINNIFNKDVTYYLTTCSQFLIKSYANTIFNYNRIKEKSLVLENKLNIKYSSPNYILIRKNKIKKIKNQLDCKNYNENQKTMLKDKLIKLKKEIELYNKNGINADDMFTRIRNSITHDNIEFKPLHSSDNIIFRDIDNKILNFKLSINESQLREFTNQTHSQLNHNVKILK